MAPPTRGWYFAPSTAASHESSTRPRSAYATLMVSKDWFALDGEVKAQVVDSSTNRLLNRTRCLQRRLHELNSSYPLVAVHNWPQSKAWMLDGFDRLSRIDRPIAAKDEGGTHLNKFSIFNLTNFDRVIYIDSDLYLRALPDPLMHMPLRERGIAAVPCSRDGTAFNSGLLVLTPRRGVTEDLIKLVHSGADRKRFPQACTSKFLGDQYFLNAFFRGNNWTRLSQRWNYQLHYYYRPVRVEADVNAHFVGRHKTPLHLCEHMTYELTPKRSDRASLTEQLRLYATGNRVSLRAIHARLDGHRRAIGSHNFSLQQMDDWMHANDSGIDAFAQASMDASAKALIAELAVSAAQRMQEVDAIDDGST